MPLRQSISFCRSADGARIAVATAGKGPPIVRAAHWLSHVERDADSPVWAPWLRALSAQNTYVRYDQRGCGLSDRDVVDFSLDALVGDLEAVAARLGTQPFTLMGMSQGGAIAIAYALRHPQRVARLVLVGAYGRGSLRRPGSEAQRQEAEALVTLVRLGWGRDNPAFRQVFTNQFIPGGTQEQHRWWNELERISASPEAAARILEAFYRIDVTDLAQRLAVPTLVLHSRGDARVPFEEGRLLAALIPGARFVPLDSDNHVLLESEPAWRHFLAELRRFLGQDTPAPTRADLASLTPAERAVLELLGRGLDNRAIAAQLGKGEKTVRNQVSAILSKLGLRSRAEAIVRLRDGAAGGAGAAG